MSYQDRIDIDRLYDLVYDTQSEQLKVITREEFEQIVGSTRDLKDKMALYPDKSEVELEIFKILRDAGVITDDKYNELIGKIQTAQNTADGADTKATNALGVANYAQSTADGADTKATNAQTVASSANSTASRAENTASDAYDMASEVDTKATQALTDASNAYDLASEAKGDAQTANRNASTALSTANDAHDLVIYETTIEEVGTVRFDVNQANSNASSAVTTASDAQTTANTANSNASTALSTANTANGNATTALSTANTADGKANQLRTDVGTVNQSDDGSLQEQITYLPAYISELYINGKYAKLDLNTSYWIQIKLSELGKKTMRDKGYFSSEIEIIHPDNSKYYLPFSFNSGSSYGEPYVFTQTGIHIIRCEQLSMSVMVGDFALDSHTHTKSQITDFSHTHTKSEITNFSHSHSISDITNLQTSLNGKANSTHSHSISDITNLQSSLDAKQDKSNYSLIADITSSSQTNGSVKVYSDGLDVLIQISGTFTNVSANGNKTIGSLNIVDYYPSMDYAISNNASIQADRQTKCWIRKSDGAVALSNGTSSTSITIYAIIRYPLASRMP